MAVSLVLVMITYNAGHEYPVINTPDRSFLLHKDAHGFVAGGMDGMKYCDYVLQLEPGTKLFVYTNVWYFCCF